MGAVFTYVFQESPFCDSMRGISNKLNKILLILFCGLQCELRYLHIHHEGNDMHLRMCKIMHFLQTCSFLGDFQFRIGIDLAGSWF